MKKFLVVPVAFFVSLLTGCATGWGPDVGVHTSGIPATRSTTVVVTNSTEWTLLVMVDGTFVTEIPPLIQRPVAFRATYINSATWKQVTLTVRALCDPPVTFARTVTVTNMHTGSTHWEITPRDVEQKKRWMR